MLTDSNQPSDTSARAAVSRQDLRKKNAERTSGDDVPKLQHNAEKLRNVALQVESFLLRQIDRLQRELEQVETLSDRDELERMTDELRQMQQKWDVERQQERSRLQEDSNRLAEAWQRLEAEQREVLKYRVSNNKMAGLGAGRAPARPVGPLAPSHPAAIEPEVACGSSGGAVATASTHKTQIQFQQLRREMMEHARQRGKR
jgi:hypothetical protein